MREQTREAASASYRACPVCRDDTRDSIEIAYITGDVSYHYPYSRGVVERHMSHVTEPEALKMALGMSTAVALAARLRYLENVTMAVLDHALKPSGPDGTVSPGLALKAVREARALLETMGKVSGALIDTVDSGSERLDIDDALDRALAARMGETQPASDPQEAGDTEETGARVPEIRAIGPAQG